MDSRPAASQGIADPPNYPAGVDEVLSWLQLHRGEALQGTLAAAVTNLNVPTCPTVWFEVLSRTPVAPDAGDRNAVVVDCESTKTDFADDIDAFVNGYAVLSTGGLSGAGFPGTMARCGPRRSHAPVVPTCWSRVEVVGRPRRVGGSCARPDLHDSDLARKDAASGVFVDAVGHSVVGSVCGAVPVGRDDLSATRVGCVSGFCVLANVLPVWGAVNHVHVAPMSDAAISIYVSNMRHENQTPGGPGPTGDASGADVLVLLEFGQGYLSQFQAAGIDALYPNQALLPGGAVWHRHLLAPGVAPQRDDRHR